MTKRSIYTILFNKCLNVIALSFLIFFFPSNLLAQVDTDFWFAVPELSHRGNTGGTPGTLRIATMELPATVTISMPANPYHPTLNPTGFQDIVVEIAGNSTAAVDLTHLIDVAASPANNRLENKALNALGINRFGLYITATNMITAYWEVNYDYGSDLWTLKGKNGLGTLFYTPFQNQYNNRNLNPKTYSSIDVVATQDNTEVTFTLPAGISASFGSGVTLVPAGGSKTVILNRGQTFSLFPVNYSIDKADRLAGTKIVASLPVAVTLKDDAIASGSQGQDVVGDQIVPVDITGNNYLVPEINNPNHIYVVGTQDNTPIYVRSADGIPIGPTPYAWVNEGDQALIIVPNGAKYANITSQLNPGDPFKPFYVYQMGIENQSRGGAIIPPIGCTGNTQLAFTRARADNKFYFFIIVEKGNEDKFLIDGIRDDGIIDPDGFTEIIGTGWVGWFSNSINSNILKVGQHLVQNTGGIFHLGILNGFPGAAQGRLYYGYYSDFGALNIGANVAGTNSEVVRACYGDPVQLYAFGGTQYQWTPDSYLDDATSNLPTAINLPPGPHNYQVEVSGACGSDVVDLTVLVSSPVKAFFQTNVSSGCSPLEIVFEDQSSGNISWQYDLGDGSPLIQYDSLTTTTTIFEPPSLPFSFSHTYTNTTDSIIEYEVTLLVKNESGCADILTKTITVFPEIQADFSVVDNNDRGCEPLEVQFQNNSTGNTDTWLWEFGDGGSSIQENPRHTFTNLFGPDSIVFTTRLVAISPYYCRDTSYHEITVMPYIEANFAFDTVTACTPHEILITDQSYGADSYSWNFGDGQVSSLSGPAISKIYQNTTPDPVTYTISLRVDNEEGCFDTISRQVTVYPEVISSFTASTDEGCSPFEVFFQNNSNGADKYFWDFGDGGTSTETEPVHLYNRNMMDHDTTYRVSLLATSDEICSDISFFDIIVHPYIEAAFTIEDITGCHPFTIIINNQSVGVEDYRWSFGDGSPLSDTSARVFEHTYYNFTGSTQVYDLQLIVFNDEGCSDTLIRQITVYPEISADFTADNFQGCHPISVQFTDLSLNPDLWYWDFGDGSSSIQPSPSHTFNNFGSNDTTYLVTLTTSTADGLCVKTVSWPITVYPNVEADFTFPDAFSCNPFELTFENQSIGGTAFTWDFGDGNGTTTNSPVPVNHVFINNSYSNMQSYPVTLQALNDSGCVSEITKTVTVYPDILAAFDASNTAGCHPLEIDFTNRSQGGHTYIWDFGDGASSDLLNPSHEFTNTGTADSIYTVQLISVAANNECRDTFSMDIVVHPYVNADFKIPDNLGCNPFDVYIENASINATVFRWNFGDGSDTITNNLDPFIHTFVNPNFGNRREFQVTLEAENFAGCKSTMSRIVRVEPDIHTEFTANPVAGCHPLDVDFINLTQGGHTYIWDFGDGASSNLMSPSHLFTNRGTIDSVYTVQLISVAANNECRDTFSLDIVVHPYVNADFKIPDNLGCNPFDVYIENASINANVFRWDFDDGSDTITNNLDPFSHTFVNPNFGNQREFQITLEAENFAGCISTIRRTVTVEPDINAEFTANPVTGCHPLVVEFTNLSSGADYYSWDFGDGTTSQKVNPVKTFLNIGSTDAIFKVWLYARASNHECIDSFELDITVHPYIKAEFVSPENIQCSPSLVTLDNSSVGGTRFHWEFGDGTDTVTLNMNPVNHLFVNPNYANNRIFNVRLTAENAAGCISVFTKDVEVYPTVRADFVPSVNEGCHPLEVEFTNLGSGGHTYFWNFDDGSTSEAYSPSHSFTNFTDSVIIRQVNIVATSRFNCTSQASESIIIHPMPKARFETDRIIDCPPFEVPLTNTSLNADFYDWTFGDGQSYTTPSKALIDHVYNNATNEIISFDLQLKATSTYGCADSATQKIYVYPPAVAGFSSNQEGCSPMAAYFVNESVNGDSYFWDFGDGSTMTIQDPTNIYFNFSGRDTLFHVHLTTTTKYGCVDHTRDSIYVYAQPEAEFIATPTHQAFPASTVNLTNATSQGNWNYSWAMGDGEGSMDEYPEPHTYANWGDYEIKLIVSSAHCIDSVSHTIRIFPAPPQAAFDPLIPGCEPHTIHFRNRSQYGDTYLWEFDDGSTSSEFEPVHTYEKHGYYNVKLTVTGEGGRDYAYQQVEVYRLPVVDFRIAPDIVMLPDQDMITFNLSEYGESYLWSFGDGATSTEESPGHLYSEIGVYSIRLDVWTEHGCTDYLIQPRIVEVVGEGLIIFPNAFKPDRNGPNGGYYDLHGEERNHIFHPYWEGVVDYRLEIYSRWGELLFTSEDVNIGWDGYWEGKIARQGVYVFKSEGTFVNGERFYKVGDVTLLH